jgi:hypothetical protein
MYVHAGNEQALGVAEKMAAWTADYTGSLSYDHMQRILGTEYGGMGEGPSQSIWGDRQVILPARGPAFSTRSSSVICWLRTAMNSRACT